MSRVLIVSHDVVDHCMAGPAIRAWEFARQLGAHNEVTLAIPNETSLTGEGFVLIRYDRQGLRELAAEANCTIVAGLTLAQHPFLRQVSPVLVVDIYDPFVLENLQLFAEQSMNLRLEDHQRLARAMNNQLLQGDFFICASEEQRDYWLGALSALGRIAPYTYDADPTLRALIDVVPFGLPDALPQHRQPVIKGILPGIGLDDKVLLWNGGIYNWLDPLTLIRAVAEVSKQRDDVRLFFMGVKHPNPRVHPMRMAKRAMHLSDELGLTDKTVFFNDWVPYEERENYLLEADLGISLHLPHIETHFAFRTRLLDCLWAGLPMIVTSGDTLARLVCEHALGCVVAPEDVENVAGAILALLAEPGARARRAAQFTLVRQRFSWDRAIEPLARFCAAPRPAPDLASGIGSATVTGAPHLGSSSWRALAAKGWICLRDQGPRALWRQMRAFVDWRWRARG
ncbi:MAG: glycosyltransferase [Anaerolineae bacterium]|nr:MAG: glycosyltransferase [Anaerolineae bacterium]